MLLEISSRVDAWVVEPEDRLWLAAAISREPTDTCEELSRAWEINSPRASTIFCNDSPKVSLGPASMTFTVRSLAAICSATLALASRPLIMEFKASTICPVSSLLRFSRRWLKSPSATARDNWTASFKGRVMSRVKYTRKPEARTRETTSTVAHRKRSALAVLRI